MNTTTPRRRALVTGASGALGQAIAMALARQGLHLILHANSRGESVRALAESLQEQGGSASSIVFDLSSDAACAEACAEMLSQGAVQVIVNNAGIHEDAVFPGMNAAQWQRVIDVNVNGFFRVTQPLVLPMLRTRWGRIINISSVAAVTGNRGQVNYAAAKAALHGATKALSLEVASRGVTVNTVAPGIIESPMAAAAFDEQAIKRIVPMQRAGRPEEVASVVAFLASDAAAYVSGQIISVNGGMA